MRRKAMLPPALTAAASLLVTAVILRATETDNRIESSFTQTCVSTTYLEDDAVKSE